MKIYCFGNEYVEGDGTAKAITKDISIPYVEFVPADSPDAIMDEEGTIYILDVVKDADDVMVIRDLERLRERRLMSLHDFDLQFFLKLMKNIGKIDDVCIFGIPQQSNDNIKKRLKEEIVCVMRSRGD